jgi:hypothetical protein
MLVHVYGIVGAAVAWLLRAGIDSCLLLWATGHILPASQEAVRHIFVIIFGAGCLLALPIFLPGLWARIAYVTIVVAMSCGLGWLYLLTAGERDFVYGWLRLRTQSA